MNETKELQKIYNNYKDKIIKYNRILLAVSVITFISLICIFFIPMFKYENSISQYCPTCEPLLYFLRNEQTVNLWNYELTISSDFDFYIKVFIVAILLLFIFEIIVTSVMSFSNYSESRAKSAIYKIFSGTYDNELSSPFLGYYCSLFTGLALMFLILENFSVGTPTILCLVSFLILSTINSSYKKKFENLKKSIEKDCNNIGLLQRDTITQEIIDDTAKYSVKVENVNKFNSVNILTALSNLWGVEIADLEKMQKIFALRKDNLTRLQVERTKTDVEFFGGKVVIEKM